MPNFPVDTYGFNLQDRLQWANISLDYLLNNSDFSYLANQKFSDGTPIYNDRELSHMVDVKGLVQSMLKYWLVGLAVMVAIWILSWKTGWWHKIRRALSIGGWLTIGLIIFILGFLSSNFYALFTDFHELFFTGNSWVFLYSDTLIRLFPMRFWEDSFIYIGIFCILSGGAMGWFLRRKTK
jgi:integral membrane protein (TIGR01906 family)